MDDKHLEATATPSVQESNVVATPPEVPQASDPETKIIAPAPATEVKTKEDTADDEIVYPGPFALSMITVALALAIFLTALDNLIIATAIPFITTQFNSLDDVGWYGAAYLITTGGFQLIWGKLYVLFPIKWVFLASITIFELGSLVCGATPNSVGLILGRAIAGLGSAGLFSGGMVIIAYSVPLAKRPIYFGIIGGVWSVASVVGPLLGGVFTDKASWRWCFYINLPIGAITIAVITFIMKHPKQEDHSGLPWKERLIRLDIPGNALFMLTIICFILAIQWGGVQYNWGNARIIVLLVLAAILLVVFIYLQVILQEKATVPPRIIKIRSIWATCVFAFFLAGSLFYTIYYLPIWFQAVQGVSAVQSGIRNLPLILSMTVASIISGGLVTALGYYTPFMIAGAILVTIGMGLVTTFTPSASAGMWIGYQVLMGFGVGLSMQQSMIAVQTVLKTKDIPTGTALVIFAQTLGGAIGVVIGQSIFGNQLVKEIVKEAPGLNPAQVIYLGATHLQKGVPAEFLKGVIQAYNDAIVTAFYVAIAFAALSVLFACAIEWKSVKKPVSGGKAKGSDVESGNATGTSKPASIKEEKTAEGSVAGGTENNIESGSGEKTDVKLKEEENASVKEEKSSVKEEKS